MTNNDNADDFKITIDLECPDDGSEKFIEVWHTDHPRGWLGRGLRARNAVGDVAITTFSIRGGDIILALTVSPVDVGVFRDAFDEGYQVDIGLISSEDPLVIGYHRLVPGKDPVFLRLDVLGEPVSAFRARAG